MNIVNLLLKAVLPTAGIAFFFGLLLAYAAKIFAVEKDQKQADIEDILPGINCGACGYPGCSGYAKAMAEDESDEISIDLCSPGGPEVLSQLGEYLDKSVDTSGEKTVAFVKCRGNQGTSQFDFDYRGMDDCNAAHILFRGDKTCKYGCLGKGSCLKVCPVDAIYRDTEGNILIDKKLCISCEKCVTICPTGVIEMVPESADVIVACKSLDKGAVVRKYCKVGCIGCKACEKASPEGGFTVENFLADIDYSKKGDRLAAVGKCPPKCIVNGNVRENPYPVKEDESIENEEN
jgi:Na+-translocating ferredoxin:NAD+ oxidoreductase subunit B